MQHAQRKAIDGSEFISSEPLMVPNALQKAFRRMSHIALSKQSARFLLRAPPRVKIRAGKFHGQFLSKQPLVVKSAPPNFPIRRSRLVYFPSIVTTDRAIQLLEKFRSGKVSLQDALAAFQAPPVADLGFAQVDAHRALRKGFAEVIYCASKTSAQIAKITAKILESEDRVLLTRLAADQAAFVRKKFKAAKYHEAARCITIETRPLPKRPGVIAVLAAGTSDLPVAEEACVTADIMGNTVERIYDVGVAGLHRLLNKLEAIRRANVVIVVAGMEGALPSVVSGLVSRPVIAVPTSVGYGANFAGLTPLLSMLNSCSSGVTVVNIDNGFGAGYAASQINELAK
jgi:hypothetical protein